MIDLSSNRLYTGLIEEGRVSVICNGIPLDPRFDLRRHSPDGFQWGYGGSGPAQLALALLCSALGDDAAALRFYHEFMFEVVAKLGDDFWTLIGSDIVGWVRRDSDRAAFLLRN